MSKEKKVTIKMDARQAAAVRQVLFDSQKGYTYDPTCVPERVVDIREVIRDIDDNLGAVLGVNE
jgi:hypothetical protein